MRHLSVNTVSATVVVLILAVVPLARGLSCYADKTNLEIKEDCGMHTGCIKKYYPKSQKVIQRACFLVPTNVSSECKIEESTGLGVCYCSTDLCNGGHYSMKTSMGLGIILPMLTYLLVL